VALSGLLVSQDLRLRRRAEDALRVSEERYRTLFNAMDEGFCVIEMIFDSRGQPVDYRFLEINQSFERQTGLSNAVGKTMKELAPLHEAHWFETYGRIAVTGEGIRFQDRAEQLHRWYDVYAFRFGDPEKRQVAILFNDITQRKKTELSLTERTAQLEVANSELEAFSYSVSHDLRAPLRHIDGFGGMLEEHARSALDEKGRRLLATIRDASTKMGRLIDNLLAFSRIGRAPMASDKVDNNELLASVIRDGRYADSGRAIVWEISPLPAVRADGAMLRQVWSNLIENAVKYSRGASPARIRVTCQSIGGDKPEYIFCVRDNGAGFDPTYANKLFGVFQRLHTESEFEGTGIGLANIRRIVTRHGGRTWAEGEIGKGAAFYFSLPRV
jgi:PAS domain S-box-containing protein